MTEGISKAIPPWRPLLRAAMQREGRSVAARWVQLATTGRDGTPRVRTLVFRGWPVQPNSNSSAISAARR